MKSKPPSLPCSIATGCSSQNGKITDDYKRELVWPAALAKRHGLDDPSARTLLDVMRRFRPSILIGLSGVGGAFDERVVREMAQHVDRPVILPSSNPISNSEARPADLYEWTDCRCLVATGSPYRDVECGGRKYRVGQGNNVFIFPGLGLGALAAEARKVTNGMANAASRALARQVTDDECDAGLLFPSVQRLREVSYEIAVAVARQAVQEGVADIAEGEIERRVRARDVGADLPGIRPRRKESGSDTDFRERSRAARRRPGIDATTLGSTRWSVSSLRKPRPESAASRPC